MPVVEVLGHRAHAAIVAAGGRARGLSRAMIAASVAGTDADDITVDVGAARVWTSPALDLDGPRAAALMRGAAALRATLAALGEPDGLARLFVADAPPPANLLADVLTRAAPRVDALAAACRTDRPADAIEPAVALLGLGPGLTPAGDDFVGGVLFARRWLATAGVADARGWHDTAARVRAAARERTHPISAALLGDLSRGESHAALHDVVARLAGGGDGAAAARALTRIGHSSGWDILAGALCGFGAR